MDKDSDDDGYSDGEEIKAKTNPTSGSSFPSEFKNPIIAGFQKVPFGFSFKTEIGKIYSVESGDDLKSWSTIREFDGTGGQVKFIEVRRIYFPHQYYRVTVE